MDNRLNVTVCYHQDFTIDRRRDDLYEKMVSHFRVTKVDWDEIKEVGGYELDDTFIEDIDQGLKMGLNFTLLAPIHEWRPWYYFTFYPPLVWKNSGPLIQIDIMSSLCFLLLMFLSAATVYSSTRCLRRRFPSTTGFSSILWDFVASFFFEPFPSDSEVLSIRLVISFWLLGITIFCNEVNAVFQGKLSVKEYAVVETEEDLDAFEYKLIRSGQVAKWYGSYKHGGRTEMMLSSFKYATSYQGRIAFVSKRSGAEKMYVQLVWLGKIESRLFEYDPRIHETIMNWELRLYEGSTGKNDTIIELEYRSKNPFNNDAQLFTAYEMADLSVPFQLYGYGLAAAIAVKFIETILAIYKNPKPKRKPKYPKQFQ